MNISVVVADANVLLSCVIGNAALRVTTEFQVSVHCTRFNADEVREYLPHMAANYRLPFEWVALQWRILPLQIHDLTYYEAHLGQARQDIGTRDIDDAHPLALARMLRLPLWSNHRDLQGAGVVCYSTTQLLERLQAEKTG